MKGLIGITMSIAVAVCAFAVYICCYEPVYAPEPQPVAPIPSLQPYEDACVVSITHPELRVELARVEAPAQGCAFCRYWFRVGNQTAAVGTKAYKTRILVVSNIRNVQLDGKSIQTLKLHGLVSELPPVEYSVLRDQDYFMMEGLCPNCLFPDQRYTTLIVEYYECAGVRRFRVVCDLQRREVTVLEGRFEPTDGCRR